MMKQRRQTLNNGRLFLFIFSFLMIFNLSGVDEGEKIFFQDGKELLSRNLSAKAIDYFRDAIDKYPKNRDAYIFLSVAYEQQNDYIEAISVLNLGLFRLGQDDVLYYNLGNCYFALTNYGQAVINYTFAINRNPDFANAYLNRGNSNVKLGKFQEAIDDYTIFLELVADDPQREEILSMIELLGQRKNQFGGYGGGGWGYPSGGGSGGYGGGSGGTGGEPSMSLDDVLDSLGDVGEDTTNLNVQPDGSVESDYNLEFDIE